MSDDLVSTTLNSWLENNPDNSELVASIDITNKKYNPLHLMIIQVYILFLKLTHLLSVLDGADSYIHLTVYIINIMEI